MSFVKIPRKYPAKPQHGSRSGKTKKKKPEWDDSVNDLSVHRASSEELMRRKLVTTSKNLDSVKEDQMRRRISKAVARDRSARERPAQNAFLKEVLYDNAQLHEVLANSDRMMAVVKDLFGDDPMKYKGAPNVTLAPEHSSVNGTLPNMELGPSKLDILSDSVMDKTALNTDEEEEASELHDVHYEPAVDLQRFHRLLELASEEDTRQQRQGGGSAGAEQRLTGSMADSLLHKLAAKLGLDSEDPGEQPDPDETLESPRLVQDHQPSNGAMNDTIKVKKTKSRLTAEERAPSPQPELAASNTSAGMNDLRRVLDGLERNIADYEKMIGREPTFAASGDDSLSGFTSRLVNAVNKITRYMRENEVRLRAEVTLREQLHQDVLFLRQLIDTLTNDIMVTQEQYITLQSDFAKYKKQTSEEILGIKQCLEASGIQLHKTVMPIPQLPQPAFTAPQQPSAPPPATQSTQQLLTNQQPSQAFQTVSQPQPSQRPAPSVVSQAPQPAFQISQPSMNHPSTQPAQSQSHAFPQPALSRGSHVASSHVSNSFIAQSLTATNGAHPVMNATSQSMQSVAFHDGRSMQNLKEMSMNSWHSQSNNSAQEPLSQRQPMQIPIQHHQTQMAPHSANASMNPLSGMAMGAAHNQVSGNDRLPAVPLNVPIQSHSPTLPEKRAPFLQRNAPVPVCPQPTFSQEPQRAVGHQRDNSHLQEAMPRSMPMASLREDAEVSQLQHSVHELQQAIDKEELSLEQQIHALQQQHEDAQNKLQLLMQHDQAADKQKAPVSPPISPITVDGDNHITINERPVPIKVIEREPAPSIQRVTTLMHTKEIKVSLPRVDFNESADRSQTSDR